MENIFGSIWATMEEMAESTTYNYGLLVIIPIVIVFGMTLYTKDTYLSFITATLVAFLMAAKGRILTAIGLFIDQAYVTLCDADVIWVLLICLLFSGLVKLLTDSGGVLGFAGIAKKLLTTRNKTLIGTWILGIIVFVDDYLNCLAVGAATKPLADEHKISREMLAYVINSTGVTVCAIVPISSWGAFFSGLQYEAGLSGGLSQLGAYVSAIPFMFYAIIAVIITPLVATGKLPQFKAMREVETRAIETGEVLSPESKAAFLQGLDDEERFKDKKVWAGDFLIPILLVAIFSIWFDDMVPALVVTLILTFLLYVPRKILSAKEFVKSFIAGLTDMFGLIVIVAIAYMFIDVNEMMGLNDFVVTICQAAVPKAVFPLLIFVGMGLMSFASGCVWTLAAIAFPIAGPVGVALGCNPFLVAGALVSACAFGGHICMYADTVLLTAASTQATNGEYLKTSIMPILVWAFAPACVLYLIFGIIL